MREAADRARIERVMQSLGDAADSDVLIYLTGGATAVLMGWRDSTVDIDFVAVPDSGELLRQISRIREAFHVNVEITSPEHLAPVPPG
jgi:hypothetical protein